MAARRYQRGTPIGRGFRYMCQLCHVLGAKFSYVLYRVNRIKDVPNTAFFMFMFID